jgi:hypothetical protein
VLDTDYPALRHVAQINEDGYFNSLRSRLMESDRNKLVLTFEELLRRSDFAPKMRKILGTLEHFYHYPVDVEFTLDIQNQDGQAETHFTLLQCRPLSQLAEAKDVEIPGHIPENDIILQTKFMVPQGIIDDIHYVVFVPPSAYFTLSMNERFKLARTIGKLNQGLKDETFIIVGPGRWGSNNVDLGIPVGYSDIFNTRALVELSGEGIGPAPEPSLGTHFFQDLLEAQIYPLAVLLDRPESILQPSFFYHAPNCLEEFITADEKMKKQLRVICIQNYRKGYQLRLVMDESHSTAIAYLQKPY